ncbi:MAG: ABC transporter permease [Cellulomonas sp.]|jgi:peptide/nickel transport system permease protein|uniref:ABC transporter permease n=1 Tax=Cellulomonas sp. TaxID=40001 RepID=UPI001A07DFFC|nr:ABC transporter permease [Cellulomonas sp.]MBF0688327.1 ABC transporter permease [Cellulomonas sp.]
MTTVDRTSEPDTVATPRRRRRRRPGFAVVPAAVVGLYVLVAVLGPVLVPLDPVRVQLADRLLAPGSTTAAGSLALMGTDAVGRDIAAMLVHGARTSILIGFLTVVVCLVIGVVVGIVAGYRGGITDSVLSRLIDVLLAFPSIVLAIVVAGLFTRSIAVVVIALALTGWIRFARLTRGETLALRERDWVMAARVLGVRSLSIMARHILPFLVGPIAALITIEFGLVVLAEAGLSFLGIGLPATVVSWGQMIANGRDYLDTAWWISAFPGLALALLVVSVGLLGDHLNSRYQRGGDIATAETNQKPAP